MAQDDRKRWGELTIYGLTILGVVVGSMALNDATSKLLVAAFLLLGGIVLGANGLIERNKTNTDGAPRTTGADQPRSPSPTLLGSEDPSALQSLGFKLREYPTFHRWEREKPPSEKEQLFTETEVVIAKNGNRIAIASVFDVHKDCAWRTRSQNRFVYENNSACGLADVLSKPKYQERLSAATDVVYVGMESFPDSPVVTECHGTLSYCRALELAQVSHRARPDNWANRKHWLLDLGTAKTDEPSHEFDQRRAIVIGLRERIPSGATDDVVRDIVMTTRVQDVDLSGYTRSSTARLVPLTLGGKTDHIAPEPAQ